MDVSSESVGASQQSVPSQQQQQSGLTTLTSNERVVGQPDFTVSHVDNRQSEYQAMQQNVVVVSTQQSFEQPRLILASDNIVANQTIRAPSVTPIATPMQGKGGMTAA